VDFNPAERETTLGITRYDAGLHCGGFGVFRYQVNDVQRAITFYTQTLGFNLDMQNLPAFGQVSIGGLKLILSFFNDHLTGRMAGDIRTRDADRAGRGPYGLGLDLALRGKPLKRRNPDRANRRINEANSKWSESLDGAIKGSVNEPDNFLLVRDSRTIPNGAMIGFGRGQSSYSRPGHSDGHCGRQVSLACWAVLSALQWEPPVAPSSE
jgi:hypothetical protein